MIYKLSETFNSIQGEGTWCGTPMLFVRLAGCNVGRYHVSTSEVGIQGLPIDLPLWKDQSHSICTTIDGQRFLCDTDYHAKEELEAEEIVRRLRGEGHVCITGGEPFLWDLVPLVEAFDIKGVEMIHVETSGTLEIPRQLRGGALWITCCPKIAANGDKIRPSVIEEVAEWKLLVGPDFKEKCMEEIQAVVDSATPLYLQPINGVNEVWKENMERCLELLKRWPRWKLSPQLHKMVWVR